LAISSISGSRFQLLGEDAPRAQHLARLLGDVHGQADRPSLVGKCA
jgi:hypothetical protein